MKKFLTCLTVLVIVAFALSSCLSLPDESVGTGDSPSDAGDVIYSDLVGLLQTEIERLRAEQTADKTEYAARIAALESELAGLKSAETDRPTDSVTDSDTQAVPEKEQFTYTLADGKATVTGYIGILTEVTVPDTLGGCPVVAIADDAFRSQTMLTSVELPSGVECIGWFAFFGCTSLKSVYIPGSVTSIGYDAFSNCPKLVIRCPSGSFAEKYAGSYGISCLQR